MQERQIVSIAEVNNLAREVLETMSFWVQGEVSGYKNNVDRSWYYFLDLKDAEGYVLPVMIDQKIVRSAQITIENGQTLLVHGKLSLYAKRGTYRMSVDSLEEAGQGVLAKELEALKAKLQAEGLLDDKRKRPLPSFPEKIGVITSISSDGWADFQRHSIAKFPIMQLFVLDVKVQGDRSAQEIIQAIRQMQKEPLDVLVVIRGGGSQEDLASYNDEGVARAIAGSRIPVIVGVGHEKDVSVADLVADVRASTPTNAGQILTKPYEEAQRLLQFQQQRLVSLFQYVLDSQRSELAQLVNRSAITDPHQWLSGFREDLDRHQLAMHRVRHKYQSLPLSLQTLFMQLDKQQTRLITNNQTWVAALHEKLGLSSNYLLNNQSRLLESAQKQLDSLSPLAILARGYSLTYANGQLVRQARQVLAGDTIDIRLHQGRLSSTVTQTYDDIPNQSTSSKGVT